MDGVHCGGYDESINFSSFCIVPVLAFRAGGGGAIDQRGAIGVDIKGYCRVCANMVLVYIRFIVKQVRTFKSFDYRSGIGASKVICVAEPCFIGG